MPRPSLTKLGNNGITLLILPAEKINGVLGDVIDQSGKITDSIAIHRTAKTNFGSHLIPLGDGHLAHIIPKAGKTGTLEIMPCTGSAHPGPDPLLDVKILPESHDDLSGKTHAGVQKSRFPVPMGGLMEIHEIHVDLIPWQIPVELGVKMNNRLPKISESADPHLRWRKSMHPEHHSRTGRIVLSRPAESTDLFRRCHHRLQNQW